MLGSVLVATKFFNDIYYSNADIASFSGVTVDDLNAIERYLLDLIDYSLFIRSEEFAHFAEGLQMHATAPLQSAGSHFDDHNQNLSGQHEHSWSQTDDFDCCDYSHDF